MVKRKKLTKVDLAFNRLLKEFKKKEHKWKQINGKNIATPGRWTLDRAYGGILVAEIINKGGGESNPFGYQRRKPSAFIKWVDDIIIARRIGKKR